MVCNLKSSEQILQDTFHKDQGAGYSCVRQESHQAGTACFYDTGLIYTCYKANSVIKVLFLSYLFCTKARLGEGSGFQGFKIIFQLS